MHTEVFMPGGKLCKVNFALSEAVLGLMYIHQPVFNLARKWREV
jgi:hypothetical protein